MRHFFASFIKRLSVMILSYSLFYLVVNHVQPPNSFAEASTWQILAFFVPLLASYIFTFNLFINYLLVSFILGLSLMVITVLQALHLVSETNLIGILIITTIFIWFFRRNRFRRHHSKGLTNEPNIPTLTKLTTKNEQ